MKAVRVETELNNAIEQLVIMRNLLQRGIALENETLLSMIRDIERIVERARDRVSEVRS